MEFTKNDIAELSKYINIHGVDDEVELSFTPNLSFKEHVLMFSYLNKLGKPRTYISQLDIIAKDYRISIFGEDNIVQWIDLSVNSTNIFTSLCRQKVLNEVDDDVITIIRKDKHARYDFESYDIRIRHSKEHVLTSEQIKDVLNSTLFTEADIYIRYKKRLSVDISDSIHLDLTEVMSTTKIKYLNKPSRTYELEVELNKSTLTEVKKILFALLQVKQQTSIPLNKALKQKIISEYPMIMTNGALIGRNPISMETMHLKTIRNRYAVSDKADGERYMMVSYDSRLYGVNSMLDIYDFNIACPPNKYIFDGELTIINNKKVYLGFDTLMYNNTDMRNEKKFLTRLMLLNDFMKVIEANNTTRDFKYELYTGKPDIPNIVDYHRTKITKYTRILKDKINDIDVNTTLITCKYFIPTYAISSHEVFIYSELLWSLYLYNKDTRIPYPLDGMIYHPMEQAYTYNRNDLPEYKWKPPNRNSIDFYVKSMKDQDNQDMLVFDSISSPGQAYKIFNLYVGDLSQESGIENIKPFNPPKYDNKVGVAYIPLVDKEAVNNIGQVVYDGTVVEFYYDNDPTKEIPFRWQAMRTRYDKTQSVISTQRKYGNSIWTSYKIWNSIINPITIDDIAKLAKDPTYMIKDTRQYFEFSSNIAMPMRVYHNWLKSNLYHAYLNEKTKMLDIGAGRGGDINKIINIGIHVYVGIDVDQPAILQEAVKRYHKRKNANKGDIPNMIFIHADASVSLDVSTQTTLLGDMKASNKHNIKVWLSTDNKYNIISCQFAIHYFFKSDIIVSGFINNVCSRLDKHGKFICTTFDGMRVHELLSKSNGEHSSSYIDDNGDKQVIMSIKKQYTEVSDTGNQIDVLMPMFSNKYETEYLVYYDYFIKQMKKVNMHLIESQTFDKVRDAHQDILSISPNKYLNEYFTDTSETLASIEISSLYRYYVFEYMPK